MRRGLLALAMLFLLMPGHSTPARPPDVPSSSMVLDEVADGLRRYDQEKDQDKRLPWLLSLAPRRDPRVAIVLAREGINPDPALGERGRQHAAWLLMEHYIPREQWVYSAKYSVTATRWWEAHGAEVRCAAQQLP